MTDTLEPLTVADVERQKLGVINARFGTPVRVNVFSGIVATVVVILAQQITSGNAAKYFNAVLGVTISTTLISYLLIYPALWKLRRSHPDTPRPFRMPWHRPLTVVLMILVAVATVQLIAPGLGKSWFGPRLHPVELEVLRAVHLPVDRAPAGAVLHRRRRAVLVDGPAGQGPGDPGGGGGCSGDGARRTEPGGELDARGDAQLAEDVLEVRVDGALGDAELLRDVAVGHPLADQRRDLPFPAGQQAGRARRPGVAGSSSASVTASPTTRSSGRPAPSRNRAA